MSLSKDSGIVVESRPFGETDKIITLISQSGDKPSFILKGIRKSKNRPIVATEIGSLIEIVYYKHGHKEVYHAKEVHVQERFDSLKSNYLGFLVTNVFCEITNRLTPPGGEYKNIFELLQAALFSLNQNGFSILSVPFFKIRLLRALGLVSGEFICLNCESDIFAKNSASINSFNLDIYCNDCKQEKNQIEILKLMKAMTIKSYSNLKLETIPISLIIELDQIFSNYMHHSLHIDFKSPEILYQAVGIQGNTD
jgi:DNA repair protein RecO (recombination protein O)